MRRAEAQLKFQGVQRRIQDHNDIYNFNDNRGIGTKHKELENGASLAQVHL